MLRISWHAKPLCTRTGHTSCQGDRADALTQGLCVQERRLRSENMRLRRELAQARAGKPTQASASPAGGPPSPSASGTPLLTPCQVTAHQHAVKGTKMPDPGGPYGL